MADMNKRFPKLSGNHSDFPDLNTVNVFKYDNDFDYSRFDFTQMELQLCTVPWDMGEVHIGNRTLSGVGNVVYFGSKQERDKWFERIPDAECHRFETKFRELHREHVIDVPVPFDMAARHNYLVVRYSILANEDSLVQYEGYDGAREWFWFVREVEFVAPNTTRLHLLEDAFQTWIYDVDVTGMVLERGHAPMFSTSAEKYLQNPLENNVDLLTDDVNYGVVSQVKNSEAVVFNDGDMYACIATTANPAGTWGTKAGNDWKTPASAYYTANGTPSVYVFAVKASDFNTLLSNVTSSYPQFKQTVQGVFFASSKMLALGTSFTFASVTCHQVSSQRKTLDLMKLDKGMFGYDARYADLAKLYTSPYAHIEITDENGNVDVVRVEDTTGTLQVSAMLNIAYPFVTLDAHLLGAGGSASGSVTYKNVDSRSFSFSGQWYETLRQWKIPTFAVVLDAATENDYATHFDRAQRKVDYDTAYANATASADTVKSNVDDTADANAANTATIAAAEKANADAGADTLTANAALSAAGNSAIAAISNASATQDAAIAVEYNDLIATADNTIISVTALSQVAATDMQGTIAANSQMAQGALSAIGSAAGMDASGTVTSIGSATIGASATLASTSVSAGLTSAMAVGERAANTAHATLADSKTNQEVENHTSARSDIADEQNAVTTGTAANSAATQKASATRSQNAANTAATRTQTTEKANAALSKTTAYANAQRSKDQAASAVSNSVKQAALDAPSVFGNFANGDGAASKPMAMFANVVTQSKSAIAAAGDEFLRYGYMYDRQWNFDGDWNIGKYFTYWKLRDFWVSNLNVPDMYMDRLRFFLYGGVTVWRKPEDIGKISVYDNFEG